jgi:pyruvate-ferredoxin/flavodoxin oxidoreductase
MTEPQIVPIDGNYAAAYVAHAMNEVLAIYPITPSSVMGEHADAFSAKSRKNVFGEIPRVYEMQSEAGAAGAIHGAISAGALSATFTASQGLMLMIPNMYKISGELQPAVFYVSARSISAHALSIFGDHSDVMAVRECGWGLVACANQQEVLDLGCICQGATLTARIPFLVFFDGFRTSHEIRNAELLTPETMRAMIDEKALAAFRARALNPDRPVLKGTAQNPDLYFQNREAQSPYYRRAPGVWAETTQKLASLTGRTYSAFDYVGSPDAEVVMFIMGSGADVAHSTLDFINAGGSNYGLVKVRLYRPFDGDAMLAALPKTVKRIAVFDRTKEPGAPGEPLYLDVVAALDQAERSGKLDFPRPLVVGGRYGLSSKDFTPSMVQAALDHVRDSAPEKIKHGFTVGIDDDVSRSSIEVRQCFRCEDPTTACLKFYGMGGDGTVGANKNSIKIIAENSPRSVQGHFVYDAKKAGGLTVSHLRIADKPIRDSYLVTDPDFVSISKPEYLGKYDVLGGIQEGGSVLLNTYLDPGEVFASFPEKDQRTIIEKKLNVFAIDADRIAREIGMPGRTNTTMQAAFFEIAKVIDSESAKEAVFQAIVKTYASKGEKVVAMNREAYEAGRKGFVKIEVPSAAVPSTSEAINVAVAEEDREFSDIINDVIVPVMHFEGDEIPVSKIPVDGVFPTDTTKYEKRSIATHVPRWDKSLCIQCCFCSFSCPHASVLAKVSKKGEIGLGDEAYPTVKFRGKGAADDEMFHIQVAPDDCTGCGVCVTMCKGKDKESGRKALAMVQKHEVLEPLRASFTEFLRLPDTDRRWVDFKTVRGSQLARNYFEFSGACPGCGETPYVKLITQLCGDAMIQSNATGCSSIYGGTAPTVPFTRDEKGRGPAWASSLFEDNAEYGFGMRLAIDQLHASAFTLRKTYLAEGKNAKVKELLGRVKPIEEQYDLSVYHDVTAAVDEIKEALAGADPGSPDGRLFAFADYLKKKVVWVVGGDGWAYDIGYGGLDHVVAAGLDVNILVMDTEVYSNTGGQRSKATPLGGVAKFAAAGKETPKKDMGLMLMNYGTAYIASVNFGANPVQTLRAFREALEFSGTSVILAYSNCIEHGINMGRGPEFSAAAEKSGYWINYRFDPRLRAEGKNPLQLDTREPSGSFEEFLSSQRRFRRLMEERPQNAEKYFAQAAEDARRRYAYIKRLSEMPLD